MSVPHLSVILPVYNGSAFLAEAIESVLNQTFRDFELLVIDDGSTDRTAEILASCRDPRLRVLRNETRRKLAGALNRGLDEACGTIVARMDADDLMRRDRLARQVAHMEAHPEIGCCGGWVQTFGDGKKRILKYPIGKEETKAFALFYAPFAHPTVAFRREWFERERLRYDGSFYPTEDYELWSRAIAAFPCGNLPRVLVDYRVHGNSMTGGEWSDMDVQTLRVHRRMLAHLGLEASEDEARIHRAASMGLLPAVPDSFEITEAWLMKLEVANGTCRAYGERELADMLNYVWFRMAMATVRALGGEGWKLYRRSRLSSMGPNARFRRWTLMAAALKAECVGRRG